MWDHFLFPFPSPLLCDMVESSGSALQLSPTPITGSLLFICRTEATTLFQRQILFPGDNHSVQMRKGEPQLIQTVFKLAALMNTHRPLQIFENVNTNEFPEIQWRKTSPFLCCFCAPPIPSIFCLHGTSQNVLHQCYPFFAAQCYYYRSKLFLKKKYILIISNTCGESWVFAIF